MADASSDGVVLSFAFEGDEALLRPYEGEVESDQLPDTLEHIYSEENQKY